MRYEIFHVCCEACHKEVKPSDFVDVEELRRFMVEGTCTECCIAIDNALVRQAEDRAQGYYK